MMTLGVGDSVIGVVGLHSGIGGSMHIRWGFRKTPLKTLIFMYKSRKLKKMTPLKYKPVFIDLAGLNS